MKAKKYNGGGTIPGKYDWVGKGRTPTDPGRDPKVSQTKAEYLEELTWQKAVEALEKRGVSMIDKSPKGGRHISRQGNPNILSKNYELAIQKAKEYDVYNQARQEAVKEFRKWQAAQGGQK